MGTRLYVGNLSFVTNEATIRESFQAFGDVTEVKLVLDRDSGRSRGFAFVEMGSQQAAASAISEMNGALLDGRSLRVSEAEERQSRSGGGGDRGLPGRTGRRRGARGLPHQRGRHAGHASGPG